MILMVSTEVFINSVKQDIVSDISIKRSYSDPICSCSFTTPLDLLAGARARHSVMITRGGVTHFNGIITSYSLSYAGKMLSLSLDCSDLSYILAHSLLPLDDTEADTLTYDSTPESDPTMVPAMTGRLTFGDDIKVGDAIEALLTGTGIEHILEGDTTSHIALRSTVIPEDLLVFDPGTTRLDVIKAWCKALGAVFYISFIGPYSVAVCDLWSNLESTTEFSTSISVSDSTHTVLSFGLESVPEMVCTRVTEEIADDSATTKHAFAITSGATAPYMDIFIPIDPNTTLDISTDVTAKLTEYNKCIERASISVIGTPIYLFNLADLSGLYTDMGISPSISVWRVTESTVTISSSGVQTDATLVSSAVEIVDEVTATSTGSYDPEVQILNAASSIVDSSNARVATVDSTATGTITVAYAGGGETETIVDRGA